MEQPAKPHLKDIEKGRHFAPEYGEPLRTFDIKTAEWTHLCSARFGEARPSCVGSATKWSGDSYRYDIFEHDTIGGRKLLALRWWNGAGEGWLCSVERASDGVNMLRICASDKIPENERWDMCHFLWQTASKSATAAKVSEGALYRQAFIEGRLKMRRKKGQAPRVEIVPNWVVRSIEEPNRDKFWDGVGWGELAKAKRFTDAEWKGNAIRPTLGSTMLVSVDHTSEVCSLARM